VGANTVIIDGTINGDLWAAGGTITVNGVVKGSVMAAGETINIIGEVGHAVRAGGKTINISGNAHGDVMVGCSDGLAVIIFGLGAVIAALRVHQAESREAAALV
jgi:hypothetical protein